jgi:nitrogen regulatory protein PII
MNVANAQLVTIVLPASLGQQLTEELEELGVSGYTTMSVNGFGLHGVRKYGLTDGANLRIETIVSESLCERVLSLVSVQYAGVALLAHEHRVVSVPAAQFAVD